MKRSLTFLFSFAASCGFALATVTVDEDAFGTSLGGWRKKAKNTVEYALSGSIYRTYRPETSKTPEGGLFVSVRIDHVRGWLSSDDHAILEITVGPKGTIDSAKSNIAIQGKSITSDVIVGVSQAGQAITQVDQAVQVGTDLVADLTAKLLRENIVEAGRVSFPAALRHNYNLLYQALRLNGASLGGDASAAALSTVTSAPTGEATTSVTSPTAPPVPTPVPTTPVTAPAPPASPAPPVAAPASPPAAPAKPAETPAAPASEETPPVAIPVPEHKPLELAPYSNSAPDPRSGL